MELGASAARFCFFLAHAHARAPLQLKARVREPYERKLMFYEALRHLCFCIHLIATSIIDVFDLYDVALLLF